MIVDLEDMVLRIQRRQNGTGVDVQDGSARKERLHVPLSKKAESSAAS